MLEVREFLKKSELSFKITVGTRKQQAVNKSDLFSGSSWIDFCIFNRVTDPDPFGGTFLQEQILGLEFFFRNQTQT